MVDDIRITLPVAEVLAAFLTDPGQHRYGLDLMAETDLASGTIYPILTRLTKAGWIESRWEDIDPVTEARPRRRYYMLTAEGAARAHAAVDALPRVKKKRAKPRSNPARPAFGGANTTATRWAW